jgi:hypothetical protein
MPSAGCNVRLGTVSTGSASVRACDDSLNKAETSHALSRRNDSTADGSSRWVLEEDQLHFFRLILLSVSASQLLQQIPTFTIRPTIIHAHPTAIAVPCGIHASQSVV